MQGALATLSGASDMGITFHKPRWVGKQPTFGAAYRPSEGVMNQPRAKELLLVGLSEGGIRFAGEGAMHLNARCVHIVLGHLARGLPHGRLDAGVRAGAETIAGVSYSKRQVQRALAALTQSGVLLRVRTRIDAGAARETPALNYIHPTVINKTIAWAKAWFEAGPARPAVTVIDLPLSFGASQLETESRADAVRGTEKARPQSHGQSDILSQEPGHSPPSREQHAPQPNDSPPRAPAYCSAGSVRRRLLAAAALSGTRVSSPLPPPGGGGGAVFRLVSGHEIALIGPGNARGRAASEFFSYFQVQGVKRWRVNLQMRNKEGARGAPLANVLRVATEWDASLAVEAAQRLEAALVRSKRPIRGWDLVCGEQPGVDGTRRVLLVDDLDGIQAAELIDWWQGPVITIETSANNHQCLLISPQALCKSEHLAATRALAQRFDADAGAVSVGQFHRFPGSLNCKLECIEAGGPFTTRTVFSRTDASADALGQVAELLGQSRKPAPGRSRQSQASPRADTRDLSNSGVAMSWTMSSLRKGVDEATILHELSTRFLGHHSLTDWPKRTLDKAREYLHEGRVRRG